MVWSYKAVFFKRHFSSKYKWMYFSIDLMPQTMLLSLDCALEREQHWVKYIFLLMLLTPGRVFLEAKWNNARFNFQTLTSYMDLTAYALRMCTQTVHCLIHIQGSHFLLSHAVILITTRGWVLLFPACTNDQWSLLFTFWVGHSHYIMCTKSISSTNYMRFDHLFTQKHIYCSHNVSHWL